MRWLERLFRDAKIGMVVRHQGHPWRLVTIDTHMDADRSSILTFTFVRDDK